MKMLEPNFIAADFGAGSGRVILGTLENSLLKIKEVHRFKNKIIENNGHIYWDFQYLFDELTKGLAKIGKSNIPNLISIGIDTWGVDYGLIDQNGKLLNNPYAYRDLRTNGIMNEVFKIIPQNEIYEKTGIQFLQFNTLFQLFASIKNDVKQLEKAEQLLFMPDLFNYYLTGEKKSEYTIASTSQLLNARNKNWDTAIFEKLNLPVNIMSSFIQPGEVMGKLLPGIQKLTNLNPLDIIAVGSHDTASAVAAVPAQNKNWAYLSSGTWSLIGIETSQPVINDRTFEYGFTNEAGVENTNRLLKNTMGLWILEQSIKKWKVDNRNINYDELIKEAEESEPFKFIIDPDDLSFLNPKDMLVAINDFCKKTNQPIPSSHGEYVRGILESLALKYKIIIDKINSLIENPIEVLHIVGGGSQNNLLNQFTANALGIPVFAGPIEATAIGNILIQAIAKDKIKNLAEGRKIVRNSFPFKKFIPKDTSEWNTAYQKFIKLI